jgi:hypothetical protein
MLLDRFADTPEDELLDRLAVSPALAGPELTFLRARIAERRGDVTRAAALVTECLKELPGHQGYLDFAVEVGAELPRRARELLSERRDLECPLTRPEPRRRADPEHFRTLALLTRFLEHPACHR